MVMFLLLFCDCLAFALLYDKTAIRTKGFTRPLSNAFSILITLGLLLRYKSIHVYHLIQSDTEVLLCLTSLKYVV